jgi:hypothetical protein
MDLQNMEQLSREQERMTQLMMEKPRSPSEAWSKEAVKHMAVKHE